MTEDFFTIRERLRERYHKRPVQQETARVEMLGDAGFLTEAAGRVILTAPAETFADAGQLPRELAERWQKAAAGNPYMLWLQGRFVEAEKANRNGALWSTQDLQFGEMSVRHGPLNWLHEEKTVIGTIADNALIHPEAPALQQAASLTSSTTSHANLGAPQPRPYMAAVSAVWKWVHPEKVQAIEHAAAQGRLYYSMECIAREMACSPDETHSGCGKSFDYITAMTDPASTCEHIQARTSARRLVDPSFLGGAVIVPPTQPGWADANVELLSRASVMAEQANVDTGPLEEGEWLALMGQVLNHAASSKHDLIFYENRSTPEVVPRGASGNPTKGYGKQTRRRPATPEEEKVIARGDWVRVDQSGKKGGDPGYKKTQMPGRDHLKK